MSFLNTTNRFLAAATIGILSTLVCGTSVLAKEYKDFSVRGFRGEIFVNHTEIEVDNSDGSVRLTVSIDTPHCGSKADLSGSIDLVYTDSYGDSVRMSHYLNSSDEGLLEEDITKWVVNDVNIYAHEAEAYVAFEGGCIPRH